MREARMRARIDVSEVEEQTKIRAKYLRALENEEWGLLPGPTYAKSFLRAYAQALGVDGRALVEEYKARFERPADGDRPELTRSPARRRPSGRSGPDQGATRIPLGYLVAGFAVAIVLILALIGALSGSGGTSHPRSSASHTQAGSNSHGHTTGGSPGAAGAGLAGSRTASNTSAPVTLSLQPTARVWVCLLGDGGRKLVPGIVIGPEETAARTFHASHFKLNLGDNHVQLTVDGRPVTVPPSSQPIGYAINASGVARLAPGTLPTCA
ncbi:MAG: helix-turn-helix domain-containing protein [Solirubrobacteraceae bacterium]